MRNASRSVIDLIIGPTEVMVIGIWMLIRSAEAKALRELKQPIIYGASRNLLRFLRLDNLMAFVKARSIFINLRAMIRRKK